jgi:hypothetical protein
MQVKELSREGCEFVGSEFKVRPPQILLQVLQIERIDE